MQKYLILSISLMAVWSHAQSGGYTNYSFLKATQSPRTMALGNAVLGLRDDDVLLLQANPSVLTSEMNNRLGAAFTTLWGGVNYGQFAIAHSFGEYGNIAGGVQYMNYGQFNGTDEQGNFTNHFYAKELAFSFHYSKQLDSNFTIGSCIKPISSVLETYTSFAVATDWGINYKDNNNYFSASLVVKNLGIVLKHYTPNAKDQLPFEIQAGFSARPKYLPLRFNFLFHNLQRFDLRYQDTKVLPTNDPITGDTIIYKKNYAEMAFRHFSFGAELKPFKNFWFRIGYDFNRRKNMVYENRKGLTGLSIGFGLKIRRFTLNYARSSYYLKTSPNSFSLSYAF